MNIEKYETLKLDEFSYSFDSDGPRGLFELRIIINQFPQEDEVQFYNLAFGIWDDISNTIDDTAETRNGDMDQILATVGNVALEFLKLNPKGWLYAEGSTLVRTRKYQMGIAKYLPEIEKSFKIRGLIWDVDNEEWYWENFKSGTNYHGFVLFME